MYSETFVELLNNEYLDRSKIGKSIEGIKKVLSLKCAYHKHLFKDFAYIRIIPGPAFQTVIFQLIYES